MPRQTENGGGFAAYPVSVTPIQSPTRRRCSHWRISPLRTQPERSRLQKHKNVAPIQIAELENWMWKNKKIRIRGGAPSKIRLSTPYYLLRKDVDRFLGAFDEFRQTKKSA